MNQRDNPLPIPIAKIDRRGPLYKRSDINKFIVQEIAIGQHIPRSAAKMKEQIASATEVLNEATVAFEKAADALRDKETAIAVTAKSAAGKVRDSVEKLHQGMAAIEKTANFDRLERYVGLLERAAAAMNALAELQKDGKLEQIAAALK